MDSNGLIYYRLFQIKGSGVQTWLACEWDNFIPKELSQDLLWGKPIFVSGISMTAIQSRHPKRKIGNRLWFDIKTKLDRNDEIRINYDIDIRDTFVNLFGQIRQYQNPIINTLLGLPRDYLIKEVGEKRLGGKGIKINTKILKVANMISEILDLDIHKIGVIGSQLIHFQEKDTSDIDLCVACKLCEMEDIFYRIQRFRKQNKRWQILKYEHYSFPYKICFKDETEVDLFPKATSLVDHFLNKTIRWRVNGQRETKKFIVTDTTLGHEGWPVIFAKNTAEPIIILCNGFRGVFRPKDVFSANCLPVTIQSSKGEQTQAWIIQDPFRDIENAGRYLIFR